MVAQAVLPLPALPAESISRGLSHEQLVDWIGSLNQSATPDYLGRFDAGALASYLDHLLAAQEPRGRCAVWVRRAETPAIVGGSIVD